MYTCEHYRYCLACTCCNYLHIVTVCNIHHMHTDYVLMHCYKVTVTLATAMSPSPTPAVWLSQLAQHWNPGAGILHNIHSCLPQSCDVCVITRVFLTLKPPHQQSSNALTVVGVTVEGFVHINKMLLYLCPDILSGYRKLL